MTVLRDNKFSAAGDCTIYELIVIRILFNQIKMEIRRNKLRYADY